MKDVWYAFYAVVLGIAAFFTGEIVTFIMLGFILMALLNLLKVQKEILRKLNGEDSDQA